MITTNDTSDAALTEIANTFLVASMESQGGEWPGQFVHVEEIRESAKAGLRAIDFAALAALGWKPIDSAPADGDCLIWVESDMGPSVMKVDRDKKGNWMYEGEPFYKTSFYIEAVAWMPCPRGPYFEVISEDE